MRIRVVNPNTTAAMTDKIAAGARTAAAPGTTIEAATSASGPISVEGFFDGALSLPGLLAEIREGEAAGVDAHVIACFDDTGLDAARSLADAPVVGIGEAAYHLATLVGGRFSVVTTLARSIPVLEQNLVRYGLAFRCASVRAAGVPVLALEKPNGAARERISAEIAAALREDRADAIVLGCAGMVDLAASLAEEHGVPVVEGVVAAVKLAETLASLRLRTSKAGGWAAPSPKPYAGYLAAFDGIGGKLPA
jgi:allantoin racemase